MNEQEELNKCRDNPAYFYNNYTIHGRANPVSEEDWDLLQKYSGIVRYGKSRRSEYTGPFLKKLKEKERK